MRYATRSIFAAMLVLGLGPTALGAATTRPVPAAAPAVAIEPTKCVTDECHANIKSTKWLHAPITSNSCEACHELTSAVEHKFRATREGADLCTYCHEFDVDSMPVIHRPVTRGECRGCHDPHGGANNMMLRENSMAELCGRCHDVLAMNRKFMHTPVARGDCDMCHASHASRFPKLLYAEGARLCLSCHNAFENKLVEARYTHKALDEGCSGCHEVHGSDFAFALKSTAPDLCMSCHDKIKSQVAEASVKHSVVLADRSCMSCHTAHGGNQEKLLADRPANLCITCHREKTKTGDGRTIAAVPEIMDPKLVKHGPVADGQCGGCHAVHGGQRASLLPADFSNVFYQQFSLEKFALCFTCHDQRLAAEEQANGVTGFRDGQRNLHFVHVNTTKGRNCRACHATHASHNQRNIRDVTQYGKWQIPINYTKTPTGGSCVFGCHVAYAYDRVNPTGSAPAHTERRMTAAARLGDAPPALVQWQVKDISGLELKVPDGRRPSVLLFVRADVREGASILQKASSALPRDDRAQVVIVLGGVQSRDAAIDLPIGWATVHDPQFELGRKLEVNAWPTAVIVQRDGSQVARMGGTPDISPSDLDAYLDFASGRITRDALIERLAQHDVVGDDTARRAGYMLAWGRRLMEENQSRRARQVLGDGLRIQPDSVELKVEMIRALSQLKQGKEAAELLASIPSDALPPWQVNLLRGTVAVASSNWPEARKALEAVLQQMPDSSEAHFLMGQVYEAEANWQKAAQEYRAARVAPSR